MRQSAAFLLEQLKAPIASSMFSCKEQGLKSYSLCQHGRTARHGREKSPSSFLCSQFSSSRMEPSVSSLLSSESLLSCLFVCITLANCVMRTRSLWPIGFLLACSAVNGAKQHAICASSGCILSDTPSNTSIGVLLRRSDIDVASLLLLEGSFSLATPVPGQDSSFLASYLGDFPDQVKQLPGAGFNYTVEGNEAEVKMNGTTQVMAFSGPDYSNAGPSANDSVRSLLILDGHFVVFSLGPSPGENGTITQRKMSVWDSVPDVSQWNLAGKSLSLESVQSGELFHCWA